MKALGIRDQYNYRPVVRVNNRTFNRPSSPPASSPIPQFQPPQRDDSGTAMTAPIRTYGRRNNDVGPEGSRSLRDGRDLDGSRISRSLETYSIDSDPIIDLTQIPYRPESPTFLRMSNATSATRSPTTPLVIEDNDVLVI